MACAGSEGIPGPDSLTDSSSSAPASDRGAATERKHAWWLLTLVLVVAPFVGIVVGYSAGWLWSEFRDIIWRWQRDRLLQHMEGLKERIQLHEPDIPGQSDQKQDQELSRTFFIVAASDVLSMLSWPCRNPACTCSAQPHSCSAVFNPLAEDPGRTYAVWA